ncbi:MULTISPECIES: hypothetical protein [Streptomyces]|jgi:hypothetical protein|uniref:Uncharacterized protein n=1 Tax=Streptomyces fradiae ATCC 10745 = DSM 40063 TaxID=1319510 RepID=A0A1Y2NTI9_STRFR|nr:MULTISPECIES: hypothetical protein [Streptomyces]KAF0646741.1 hypothetical protein K701_27560 [Streptomyces fradiae ATCC 10745 = DSM 40063]OSY50630.1 hypothetical protein BG846_03798 [Streptomyces fradiae ATCC 10745 = DSM 40063]QEV11650.1 hypothetical protein CP974_06070 [Streptomyces fradiae ATCC 10745 = DSM 40063]
MTQERAAAKIPIVTSTDGHPYIPAEAAIALLRAIAQSCRNLADDPDCDLLGAAAAIDSEADYLDIRAIERTTIRTE